MHRPPSSMRYSHDDELSHRISRIIDAIENKHPSSILDANEMNKRCLMHLIFEVIYYNELNFCSKDLNTFCTLDHFIKIIDECFMKFGYDLRSQKNYYLQIINDVFNNNKHTNEFGALNVNDIQRIISNYEMKYLYVVEKLAHDVKFITHQYTQFDLEILAAIGVINRNNMNPQKKYMLSVYEPMINRYPINLEKVFIILTGINDNHLKSIKLIHNFLTSRNKKPMLFLINNDNLRDFDLLFDNIKIFYIQLIKLLLNIGNNDFDRFCDVLICPSKKQHHKFDIFVSVILQFMNLTTLKQVFAVIRPHNYPNVNSVQHIHFSDSLRINLQEFYARCGNNDNSMIPKFHKIIDLFCYGKKQ